MKRKRCLRAVCLRSGRKFCLAWKEAVEAEVDRDEVETVVENGWVWKLEDCEWVWEGKFWFIEEVKDWRAACCEAVCVVASLPGVFCEIWAWFDILDPLWGLGLSVGCLADERSVCLFWENEDDVWVAAAAVKTEFAGLRGLYIFVGSDEEVEPIIGNWGEIDNAWVVFVAVLDWLDATEIEEVAFEVTTWTPLWLK